MKINIDIIKKIGKDKLILIIIAVIILILCTVWENSDNIGKVDEKADTASTYSGNADDGDFMTEYVKAQEKKLKEVLGRIDGVGEIHVMITIKNSSTDNILMEKDISSEDTSEDDGAGGTRNIYTYSEDNNTVYVTDENGKTVPYVLSRMAPEVEGVAVIAEGGDNVIIKEKIINVIKALFNIDINKISVTK